MPLFAWANGTTPAQIRTQADTDMDLIMGADNWLVIAARALNAAGWFMARIHEPAAQQMLFSHIVWDPAFLSQLLQSVLATLPTQTVPSLEAALQIWVATVASSTYGRNGHYRTGSGRRQFLHPRSSQYPSGNSHRCVARRANLV